MCKSTSKQSCHGSASHTRCLIFILPHQCHKLDTTTGLLWRTLSDRDVLCSSRNYVLMRLHKVLTKTAGLPAFHTQAWMFGAENIRAAQGSSTRRLIVHNRVNVIAGNGNFHQWHFNVALAVVEVVPIKIKLGNWRGSRCLSYCWDLPHSSFSWVK